jgi:hypothetical protein
VSDIRTPLFLHRRNRDGSYESICPGCFLTVSHAETQDELTELDNKHVSECSLLAERGMYYSPIEIDGEPVESGPFDLERLGTRHDDISKWSVRSI